MSKQYQYLIGADGGGTGTRVLLARADGAELGRGSAGPSGLMHGIENAWATILYAMKQAFAEAGLSVPALAEIAAGCGLAGVHNKQWAADFIEKNPGFGALAVGTDGQTTLLGAHQGQAGAIIAIGTGSVGEVLLPDGSRREVGAWGFPSSDEASGAWLGLHTINHVQHVLDGRSPPTEFAAAVIEYCGGDRDGVFNWLAQANQTAYAQLARFTIRFAPADAVAHGIMLKAGEEIAKMAQALDPSAQLPIALCGGLAAPLRAYLPPALLSRVVQPQADSATGALILIKNSLSES
ncbi:BadF/BadG/BcrA/BcrD ATPase family protein [Undibacterium sp.]|uniref:BadF/BadG/BcrA/BcrD ATPase family protein n=1 Tax=Undibacterium sp. TaxID=1914977 RepID=UPI002C53FD56|nr:BadF/BadG/BcrA/BcrD ATPase family protein [Undibacterium sp.]HTD05177.1 BadF/BadG/BcrA/BcrD ATPase family protein [Undibacterium sp.]